MQRLMGLAAIAVLAVVVAACGSDSDDSGSGGGGGGAKKSIMAFVMAPRGTNDVTRAWFNGLEAGARQAGDVNLEVKAPGKFEQDPGIYLNFIRSALVKNPEGVIVIPNNAAGMKSGLEQIAKNRKVLIMDQDVKGMTGKVSFVGTDNIKAGKTAAEWMLEQYKDKKLRSNEVAILGATVGTSSTDDRLTGFQQGIAGSPLKIVSTLRPACDDPTKARAAMADVLTAHPNLGGVFSVCDAIALGASRVIADKGNQVKQIGVDASKQGVETMLAHKGLDAEIAQHFYDAGVQSVKTLVAALDGDSVPANVDTGVLLVTEDNAQDYLVQAAKEAK